MGPLMSRRWQCPPAPQASGVRPRGPPPLGNGSPPDARHRHALGRAVRPTGKPRRPFGWLHGQAGACFDQPVMTSRCCAWCCWHCCRRSYNTIDGRALAGRSLRPSPPEPSIYLALLSAGPRTSSPICVLARHGQPISGQRRATVPSSDLRNVLQTSRLSGRPAARPLGRRGSRHGPACSTQD